MELPTFELKFTMIAPILLGLIGVVTFQKMWRFIFGELKTAPRESWWGSVKNTLSGLMFVVVSTTAIVLVAALVISSLAVNTIFGLQETKLIFIDAMVKPFQYSTIIPYALYMLFVFVGVYPIIEFLTMGKETEEGAMEIQRAMERNIINRVSSPWSYFIAFGMFLLVVIVPPVVLSLLARHVGVSAMFDSVITEQWVYIFIFFAFVSLGPIFYLAYYSTYGNAQVLFKSFRVLSTRKSWKGTKLFTQVLLFLLSSLAVISAVFSLLGTFPILLGESPQVTTSYKDVDPGFLGSMIELLVLEMPGDTTQNLDQFYLFTAILPLDFLLFFLTTVTFGLVGFYSKFLSKEPLNRSQMVLFAAYIITGVAFEIFLNILIQWPWVLPDLLFLEMADPTHQQIMIFFFAPALALTKIFTVGFLIFHVAINPSLRKSVDQEVLNEAINQANLIIIHKYRTSKNPDVRLMVASSLEDFITGKEGSPNRDKLLQIIESFIGEQETRISEQIAAVFERALLQYPVEHFGKILAKIFSSKEYKDVTMGFYIKALVNVGIQAPEKVTEIMQLTLSAKFSEYGEQIFMDTVKRLSLKSPKAIVEGGLLLLNSKNMAILTSGVDLIKQIVGIFQEKFPDIYDRAMQIVRDENLTLAASALDLVGRLLALDGSYLDKFLQDCKTLPLNKIEIKIQYVGVITNAIVNHPAKFSSFFPLLEPFFKEKDPVLRENLALTLGILPSGLSTKEYLSHIHPLVKKMAEDGTGVVKTNLLQSIIMIGKLRQDIFELQAFQTIFIDFLLKEDQDIRHQIFHFFEQVNVKFLLDDFNRVLVRLADDPSKISVLGDFIDFLQEMAKSIYKDIENSTLIGLFLKKKFTDLNIRIKMVRLFTNYAQYSEKICKQVLGFLNSELKGRYDETAAIVFKYFAKDVLHSLRDAEYSSISGMPSAEMLLEAGLKFMKSKQVKTEAEVLHFLDNVMHFEQVIIPDEYDALLLKVLNASSPIVLFPAIKVLLRNAATMAKIQENWKGELLPGLTKHLLKEEPEDLPLLQEILNGLAAKISNPKEIKKVLLKITRKGLSMNARITSLKALALLKEPFFDKKLMKDLLKLMADKEYLIRSTAMEVYSQIIQSLIALKEVPSSDAAYGHVGIEKQSKLRKKTVEKLLYSFIRVKFMQDQEKHVRFTYLDQISQIVLLYPEFPKCMLVLIQAIQDPKRHTAMLGLRTYFKFLNEYPEKIPSMVNNIFSFADNQSIGMKLFIVDAVGKMVKDHPESTKLVFPILQKLSYDKDPQVRIQTLKIFRKLLKGDGEYGKYIVDVISKLLDMSDPRIRRTAVKLSLDLVKIKPDQISSLPFLPILFKISRDRDLEIKRMVVDIIPLVIHLYPKRLSRIVGVILNLLRELDKKIIEGIKEPLLEIFKKDSKQKKPVLKNLKKYQEKSQNPELAKLQEAIK